MNLNVRQIEAFVLCCRLGSMTKAAETMCITQSAVSVLVRQMEMILGVRLFDRTTRSLRVTQMGKEALATAQSVLRDLDYLRTSIQELALKTRGEVKFAATVAAASALMPPILARFKNSHPDIKVIMYDVSYDQLVPKVLSEHVEFSIGTVDKQTPFIRQETILRDHVSMICPRNSALSRRNEVSWDELDSIPTISGKKEDSIRWLIDQSLQAHSKIFEPAYEVSYLATMLSMTAHGLGMSVIPTYLVPFSLYPTLTAVKLIDPIVTRELSLITKNDRSLSPAAESLTTLIRTMTGASFGGTSAQIAANEGGLSQMI